MVSRQLGSTSAHGWFWQEQRGSHGRQRACQLCKRHGGKAPRPGVVRARPQECRGRRPAPLHQTLRHGRSSAACLQMRVDTGRWAQRPLEKNLIPPAPCTVQPPALMTSGHSAVRPARAYATESGQGCHRKTVRSVGPTDGDRSPLSTAGKRQAWSLMAWVQIPPFLFITYDTQASGLTTLRSRPPLCKTGTAEAPCRTNRTK